LILSTLGLETKTKLFNGNIFKNRMKRACTRCTAMKNENFDRKKIGTMLKEDFLRNG
jgi:hypothetical protein